MASALFSSAFSGYLYYIIPLIFTFALVYGILVLSKIFDKQKNVNSIIAIAIALFAIMSNQYIQLLYEWMPALSAVFIVVFFLLMLKNLFLDKEGKEKYTWPMLITIAILFLVFITLYPIIPLPHGNLISSEDVLVIIGVGFVAILILIGAKLGNQGFDNAYDRDHEAPKPQK